MGASILVLGAVSTEKEKEPSVAVLGLVSVEKELAPVPISENVVTEPVTEPLAPGFGSWSRNGTFDCHFGDGGY